jgi:hypothetical protein
VENAAYLRARAERFLTLANLMSDAAIADALLVQAAGLHARALELEAQEIDPKL